MGGRGKVNLAKWRKEKAKQKGAGKDYPTLCPICDSSYYAWYPIKGLKYSLTGEYQTQTLESVEYVHDDGLVCSKLIDD